MPTLKITLDNHIRLQDPPQAISRRCKQDLTIDNPAYEDAKKFGRRTWAIPKKIRPYQEEDGLLSLPRGYWKKFISLVHELGYELDCTDDTISMEPQYPPKDIELRDYQQPWITKLLAENQGLGVAPPGAGKTIMALEMYAKLGQPCLWITHTGRLVKQARTRAEQFLGIETGIIGKGQEDIKHFTVGTVQTLVRRDLSEYANLFGLIIVDECHHVPSSTFLKVVSAFKAKYRYGVTATPYRADGLGELMYISLGEALASLSREELREVGALITPTIVQRPTKFHFPYNPHGGKKTGYKALTDAIAADKGRNTQIVTDVLIESSINPDNVCIVLVGRIPHGENLYEMLSPILPGVGLVHSKMTNKQSDAVLDDFESGRLRVLIATYKMLAEGFDYQPSNRLFLTAPFKVRSLIEQACGRVERAFPGKENAFIYDYVDNLVGVLERQAQVRLDTYEANNNPIITIS